MTLKMSGAGQAAQLKPFFMPRQVDESTAQAIGERLRVTREVIGLKQREFAKRAGVSATAYNQYEVGDTKPKIENAIKLREAFNLTLDWIYCGDPSGLPYTLAEGIKAIRHARRI
jgi:transcriptional regulator with XRE-family HTH domain